MRVIECLSEQGFGNGEDRYGYTKNAAWVIDGSSGLSPNLLKLNISDPAWFASQISSRIQLYIDNMLAPLSLIVRRSLYEVRQEFVSKTKQPEDLLPTGTIAVVRQEDDELKTFVLGDSGYIIHTSPKIYTIIDDRVFPQNEEKANIICEYMNRYNVDFSVARGVLKDELKKFRNRAGKEYFLLSGKDYTKEALMNSFDVRTARHIVLGTDGFFDSIYTFGLYDSGEQLMKELLSGRETLRSIWEKKHFLEQTDHLGKDYCRTRQGDDTTAIWLEV